MTTRANKILLTGGDIAIFEEDIAGGTIKPGHLIEIYNNSSTRNVRVHSTAGGRAEAAFAIENGLDGPNQIEGASPPGYNADTAYVATNLVFYAIPPRGSLVSAMLTPAVAYAIGDKLVSAGDGTLKKASALASAGLDKETVAVIYEALDLSATGAVAARGVVRIL